MGIGFVAIVWVILVILAQILLSPLSWIGWNKFKKTEQKGWLIFLFPAVIILAVPILGVTAGIISLIVGDHGPLVRPAEKDVIGVYSLSPESREYLKNRKKYQEIPEKVFIQLDSDGSMKMVNLPDCLFADFGRSNGKFETRTENWKLGNSGRVESWFSGWPLNGGQMSLTGKGPNYMISATIGDPDSGEEIQFRK